MTVHTLAPMHGASNDHWQQPHTSETTIEHHAAPPHSQGVEGMPPSRSHTGSLRQHICPSTHPADTKSSSKAAKIILPSQTKGASLHPTTSTRALPPL